MSPLMLVALVEKVLLNLHNFSLSVTTVDVAGTMQPDPVQEQRHILQFPEGLVQLQFCTSGQYYLGSHDYFLKQKELQSQQDRVEQT